MPADDANNPNSEQPSGGGPGLGFLLFILLVFAFIILSVMGDPNPDGSGPRVPW